jgi:chromosome segregation ATPase
LRRDENDVIEAIQFKGDGVDLRDGVAQSPRTSEEVERFDSELTERRRELDAEYQSQEQFAAQLRERRASLNSELEAYRADKVRMFSQCRDDLESYRNMLEERRVELEAQYVALTKKRDNFCAIQETLRSYAVQTGAMIALLERNRAELPSEVPGVGPVAAA